MLEKSKDAVEMGEKVGGSGAGPVEEDGKSKVGGDTRGVEEGEEEMRQEE